MQDTIANILDLTSSLFQDKYNFTEVYPSLRFIKSNKNAASSYRAIQLVISGTFENEGKFYETPDVAILTYADPTYEEAIARTLKEIQNFGRSSFENNTTYWNIENLIIKPSIEKAESI